jgi:hypothetical protein
MKLHELFFANFFALHPPFEEVNFRGKRGYLVEGSL